MSRHHGDADHHHAHQVDYNRAFAVGVALNVIYVVVEAAYGFAVNSLSLLADAGHNLSDVLGLVIAWGAHFLSQVKPTRRRTYGWGSSSILSAMLNSLLLVMAVGAIVWEAMGRLNNPVSVAGGTMMFVAGVGVVINTLTALLFHGGRKHDLNIRGAYLHMAADAGVSCAVVLGGLGISLYGWTWLDPALSLVIAVVILVGTWGLLRDSVNLILHAVPSSIDPAEVQDYLAGLAGVVEIHDLHIWALSTTETALTAHLVRPESDHNDRFLHDVDHELRTRFRISHATIQIEQGDDSGTCRLASPDSV